MVCDLINLSVQWRPWKELSSWETQLELRMACYLQYFIIKVLSILNDEQLSIAIQNTAKFKMQGNLYCGEGSHLRDREAVRLRDNIYLHFALTDWKQAGFPETWLWKYPRGSLMRLGPSNFPQKYIFTLSALWMCRAVAFCKRSRKEVAQKSWPSFPHPWTQWEHTLLQAIWYPQFLSLVPAPTSSLHPRGFFPYSASLDESLQTCWVQFQKNPQKCGNHPGQKLFLEAVEMLKQFHSWPAVAESTSFPTEVLGAIFSTLSWSSEPPECTRKAFSSPVVHHPSHLYPDTYFS